MASKHVTSRLVFDGLLVTLLLIRKGDVWILTLKNSKHGVTMAVVHHHRKVRNASPRVLNFLLVTGIETALHLSSVLLNIFDFRVTVTM